VRTYILAPTQKAADVWAAAHGLREWFPLDAPFRLRGLRHGDAEVVVLDGGGTRFDRDALLTVARERGLTVRHDRSAVLDAV
jgi:hypothetical protein